MGTLSAPATQLATLDFDIENRPLSYWQPDRPTAQITSIAWMWAGDHDTLDCLLLAPPCFHRGHEEACPDWPRGMVSERTMLERFSLVIRQADVVTGHYILRHDLPILNGALYDNGLPLLNDVRASDTKLHMFTKADVPATQEHLLELLDPLCPLGIPLEKFHMTQARWREANRLTPQGVELTRRRVMSDVHAHSHMREAMVERGWLGQATMWRGRGGEVVEGHHL
jgi:hypothetical protein